MVATLVLAGCAATPRIVHDKTGATSTLEQLKGRAVVLTFWVDYCQPCMAQMPVVMESVAAHGDRVVFLPVYSREKPGHRLDGWLSTQPEWFRDQICWANSRTTIAPSFPAPTSTGGTACWWRASTG